MLLVIFAAIGTFVLSGLAIRRATVQASVLARQKLGSTLTLSYDMQKAMSEARAQGDHGDP